MLYFFYAKRRRNVIYHLNSFYMFIIIYYNIMFNFFSFYTAINFAKTEIRHNFIRPFVFSSTKYYMYLPILITKKGIYNIGIY